MEKHHDLRWLYGVLDDAVKSFNASPDKALLLEEKADDGEYYGTVGERAVAHRLAVHLEQIMEDNGYPCEAVPIATDCEYNRHRGTIKEGHVKDDLKKTVEHAKREIRKDPKMVGWYFFSVFPDIIVHERGVDKNNLIVIELKRASNNVESERDYDHLKLKLFTEQHILHGYGYKLGASVVAWDKGKPESRELKISAAFFDLELIA